MWHLMVVAITVLIVWTIMYFIVHRRSIVKWGDTKYEALESEYTENLIEDKSMTNGTGLEVDTKL